MRSMRVGGRMAAFAGLLLVPLFALVAAPSGAAAAATPSFQPIVPVRIMDTRAGVGTPAGPLGAGETRALVVAGQAGIPADAVAVALNVTVTEPTATSYLTVWPDGGAMPTASNVNFIAGQTIANMVTVGLGGGQIDLFNFAGDAHVVVDVTGWYTGTPLASPLGVPVNPPPGLPPPPTRLVIPRLGLDTDLAWASSLDDLVDTPGWLPGSGLTGVPGNMVIAGHRVSHTHPFRFIDAMQPGDEIYVYADGKYTYQVVGSVVVDGGDYNAIVAQTADPTVTLYACHPPGSIAQRWLVKGDYLGDY